MYEQINEICGCEGKEVNLVKLNKKLQFYLENDLI